VSGFNELYNLGKYMKSIIFLNMEGDKSLKSSI